MFDGDLERNRSRARQSSVQSLLSGLRVTETRERSGRPTLVVRHLEPLEFHCFDGFYLDGTANHVLLT